MKLAVLIDSFGLTMLDQDRLTVDKVEFKASDAMLALSYFNDKRTIKYFVLALETFTELDFYSRPERAAYALGKYEDDAAIAALAQAIDSRD